MNKVNWKFRNASREAIAHNGWVRDLGRHMAVFVPRGRLLLVTFDRKDMHLEPAPRYPWGSSFAAKAGYSHLGIIMKGPSDWFRQRPILDFFDELRDEGFFEFFDEVVFYGSSMGGFAACTFSAAAPGARVVAFSPQSTLRLDRAPFEKRYFRGYTLGNWDDPRYVDAATTLRLAGGVSVFCDPFHTEDAAHLARLPKAHMRVIACPYVGHRVPQVLSRYGGFSTFMQDVIEGRADVARIRAFMAGRKRSTAYHRQLAIHALNRNHPELALRVIEAVQARDPQEDFPVLIRQAKRRRARMMGVTVPDEVAA